MQKSSDVSARVDQVVVDHLKLPSDLVIAAHELWSCFVHAKCSTHAVGAKEFGNCVHNGVAEVSVTGFTNAVVVQPRLDVRPLELLTAEAERGIQIRGSGKAWQASIRYSHLPTAADIRSQTVGLKSGPIPVTLVYGIS